MVTVRGAPSCVRVGGDWSRLKEARKVRRSTGDQLRPPPAAPREPASERDSPWRLKLTDRSPSRPQPSASRRRSGTSRLAWALTPVRERSASRSIPRRRERDFSQEPEAPARAERKREPAGSSAREPAARPWTSAPAVRERVRSSAKAGRSVAAGAYGLKAASPAASLAWAGEASTPPSVRPTASARSRPPVRDRRQPSRAPFRPNPSRAFQSSVSWRIAPRETSRRRKSAVPAKGDQGLVAGRARV